MTTLELCCGTAIVTLTALAGFKVDPLTGYMGGKRRWAPELARVAFGEEHVDEAIT